jgi:hypothetical protein
VFTRISRTLSEASGRRGLTALKEWAIICNALEDGSQAILLRKGGILEYKHGFQVTHNCFYLYPTFEHQSRDYLKSQYWEKMDETLRTAEFDENGKVVIIRSWGEVKQIHKIRNMDELLKIRNYHIWSDKYLQMRLNYNSSKPLYLLVVRVYKLVQELKIEILPQWSGCKSWVDIDIARYENLDNRTDINKLDLLQPVIVDSEFQKIRDRLEKDLE